MQADKVNHTFKPGSRFENVIALNNFDRELRILLFDVIERIEVQIGRFKRSTRRVRFHTAQRAKKQTQLPD
jgi:abortive infection bacteriophage resistance protein